MADNKDYTGKRMVTETFRCAFMSVFKPKKNTYGGEDKHEITMLFPKDSDVAKKFIADLREEAIKVAKVFFGGSVPASVKEKFEENNRLAIFKNGDNPNSEGNIFDGFAGHIAVKATSKAQPSIIDGRKEEILDSNEFRSGDYARASITPYAYDVNGNKGVGFFIGNIQKMKSGEPFGGRVDAKDEFDEVNEGGNDTKGVFGEPEGSAASKEEWE
jgi:hypothetical protein